jgi:hypothetical protein
MKEKAIRFCQVYRIPIEMAEVLIKLPRHLWDMFSMGQRGQNSLTIRPAWYSGTGCNTRKVDYEYTVLLALQGTSLRYECENISKRGGCLGKRIKIIHSIAESNTNHPNKTSDLATINK